MHCTGIICSIFQNPLLDFINNVIAKPKSCWGRIIKLTGPNTVGTLVAVRTDFLACPMEVTLTVHTLKP